MDSRTTAGGSDNISQPFVTDNDQAKQQQWSSSHAPGMSSALGKRDDLQNICWSYQFCHKEMKTTFEEKRVKETRRVPLLGKTQMQELLRVLRAKD